MQPKIKEVTAILEEIAPLSLQESYDNSGLLVGDENGEVKAVLVALDVTEEVVDEAIANGANLIVSHHPVIFSGLRRLNGKNYVERAVMKAVKNDIAIYSIHTNLDNVLKSGVNQKIAERLGVKNGRILAPVKGKLQKLVCYCPSEHIEAVQSAIFEAGAGQIGKYSDCSFSSEGVGTFKPGEGSTPFYGQIGILAKENEFRLEVVLPSHLSGNVISAMKEAHPYEEVAYDLYNLENYWQESGAGLIGDLAEPVKYDAFLELVKEKMNAGSIRFTDPPKEHIQKVALCGGSGSFLLNRAKEAKADVFLTADFKYHQFFDAENKIMICDIGHYESEQFTIELIRDIIEAGIISKKIANFAVIFTKSVTNPVRYFN